MRRSYPRSFSASPAYTTPFESLEVRHDLFGAGHLRNTARIDEARDLDGTEPGARELADELGAERRRQDVRLVLEPIARAHVDDEHCGWSYASAFVFSASSRSRSVIPSAVCVHQRSVTCL